MVQINNYNIRLTSGLEREHIADRALAMHTATQVQFLHHHLIWSKIIYII